MLLLGAAINAAAGRVGMERPLVPQDDDTGVGRGVRKALPDEHSTTPSRGPHERNQSPQTASAAPANNPVHRSAKPPPQQHPLGALRSPRTSRHRRSRAPVPSSTHTKGERGCFLPHLPRWVTRSTPAEGGRGEVRQGDPGLHWASSHKGTGTPKVAAAATGPGARPPRCFTGTCRGGAGELLWEGRMPGSRGPGNGEGPCTGQRQAPQVWGLERITGRPWSLRADAYKQVAS